MADFQGNAVTASEAIIDALGQSVTLSPQVGSDTAITVVFDRAYTEADVGNGVSGERTWCEAKSSDADVVEIGDSIVAPDATYIVTDKEQADYYGVTMLILEHASTP
ncbi:MAG: head-tail joining protein [Gammaproteobacteria bacterium]